MSDLLNATVGNTTALCSDVTPFCHSLAVPEGTTAALCENLTSFCSTLAPRPITPVLVPAVSLASICIILAITGIFIIFSGEGETRKRWQRFLDIIREDDWYPSLARTQFLIWTIIISFSYFLIELLRLLAGVYTYPDSPPYRLLLLMGISLTVPLISGKLTPALYAEKKVRKRPDTLPPFCSMFLDNDKPSLTRLQMFVWTLIGVLIYLFVLFSSIQASAGNAANLQVPDIDVTLVFLMGLSQGAYLGGKLVLTSESGTGGASSSPQGPGERNATGIERILPDHGRPGQQLVIIGKGFGESRDIVMINERILAGSEISEWGENRIVLTIPEGIRPVSRGMDKITVSTRTRSSAQADFTLE